MVHYFHFAKVRPCKSCNFNSVVNPHPLYFRFRNKHLWTPFHRPFTPHPVFIFSRTSHALWVSSPTIKSNSQHRWDEAGSTPAPLASHWIAELFTPLPPPYHHPPPFPSKHPNNAALSLQHRFHDPTTVHPLLAILNAKALHVAVPVPTVAGMLPGSLSVSLSVSHCW